MDGRTWLKHRVTGGYFHCPDLAVEDMAPLGWEPSDPPPEPVSPAVAEQLAWRAEQAAATESKTKAARRGNPEQE